MTESTDEWALAALAYECLTGANPFAAPTVDAARALLQSTDPRPPSAFDAQLSPPSTTSCSRASGREPFDRYPSVAAFADALLPHLGDPAARP